LLKAALDRETPRYDDYEPDEASEM